jgi:hypothetical protein
MRAGYYKYIAVRWQSLLIASRKPQETITALETTHKFRLKDQDQPPSVYALATTRGHLCYAPIKYSTSREDDWGDFKRIFGHTPQAIFTLANGDRLDTSTYWTWGGIQNISVTGWSLQKLGHSNRMVWCGLLSWQCLDFVLPPKTKLAKTHWPNESMDTYQDETRHHSYRRTCPPTFRKLPLTGNTHVARGPGRGVESTLLGLLRGCIFTTYVV